jgi:hypothetical protein
LLQHSGLSQARSEATIEFTLLDGYTQTSDIIKAHGYDLARDRGVLPTPSEIAAHWYDTIYLPAVAAAERASLPSCTTPGTPPTATSSCGSTRSAATSVATTLRSTSTPPPDT